jgi:hypothetical protein
VPGSPAAAAVAVAAATVTADVTAEWEEMVPVVAMVAAVAADKMAIMDCLRVWSLPMVHLSLRQDP